VADSRWATAPGTFAEQARKRTFRYRKRYSPMVADAPIRLWIIKAAKPQVEIKTRAKVKYLNYSYDRAWAYWGTSSEVSFRPYTQLGPRWGSKVFRTAQMLQP